MSQHNTGKATTWTALGSAKLPDLAELENPAEAQELVSEPSPKSEEAPVTTEIERQEESPAAASQPEQQTEEPVARPAPATNGRSRKPKKIEVVEKTDSWERFTVNLRPDLIDRVRDVCWWSRISVAGFVTEAVNREIRRLEKERNEGKPFAPREGNLKKGPGIR